MLHGSEMQGGQALIEMEDGGGTVIEAVVLVCTASMDRPFM